ncbi:hypothetical protein [Thermosipho sp. 1074]|uniref:hypothetical protein n=1 Tax=Thermosipho sp. 1074 TaxID=1643331 RepID=UPI0009849038|nr:hypothetical protein [Thermosipho sp. 1074]OOC42200.1 hypothetical protein XO08_07930 [Thermosipho sp. 1074]
MDNLEHQVIKNTENIKSINEDIKEIKESIKNIEKKMNGYLDKKIEIKIKSMSDYFQELASDAYAKLAGKRALAFAISLILSLVTGALAGRFFWR